MGIGMQSKFVASHVVKRINPYKQIWHMNTESVGSGTRSGYQKSSGKQSVWRAKETEHRPSSDND